MRKIKIKPWYGLLGFFGLLGFMGLVDSNFYMFFMFFGFFGFYWEAKINYDLDDERLQYNTMRAKSKLLDISSVLMVVFIMACNYGVTADLLKIILSLYFAILIAGRAYLTYYYDTKGV